MDNSNTLQLTLQIKDDGTIVIDRAVGKIKDLEGQTQKGQTGLESFSKSWMGITAKITGFIAAGYGAYRMLDSFISEAAEAEAIENRLKFALETTGYSWSAAKSAVDEFAQSIQASTRFSDEQARQSLTDMMMYTQDFSKAQMGAKLAMDMSIRTSQDLGSSNRLIGMAMSGNVEMLGRYIPELRNLDTTLGANATQAQKAEYALKILQQKFGGTAQTDLDTYAGKVAQFKNQWSDLKEEIGGHTLPILGTLLDRLRQIAKASTEALGGGSAIKQLGIGLHYWEQVLNTLQVEDPYNTKAIREAETYIDGLRSKIEQLQAQAQDLAGATIRDILPEAKKEIDIVKEVQAAIEGVQYAEEQRGIVFLAQRELIEGGWTKEKGLVEQVLDEIANLERATNEWGEITMARQELVEAGWKTEEEAEAERISEGIENARLLHQAWLEEYTKTSQMGETLAKNMASAWNFNIKNIITDSKNMGDVVQKVFYGMSDAFSSAVSKMISDWILFGNVKGEYEAGSGIIGGLGGGLGNILGFQGGGDFWVNKPTPILVGEGGERERVTVTPESKMRESKGGDIYYYIDARGAQQGVSKEILRALRETENRAVKRSVNEVADRKLRGGKFAKIFD